MQPDVDTWKTMRRLDNEYRSMGVSEPTFTQFVMERLQCPSYRDAELAIDNYEHAKREARRGNKG